MPISSNLRAALFMVVAMASFTMNDTLTKAVLETTGLSQTLLVRGLFASALILLVAWHRGALAKPSHVLHPTVALRTACEMAATITFLGALAHMPLGNISAMLQALPLAITMGAALFFGEKVGWRRWLAIVVGFAGVLIIVQPGLDGFNRFSLLALASVLFAGMRDLVTRSIPGDVPTLLISAMTAVTITFLGGVMVLAFGGWAPMSGPSLGMLGIAAVLLVVGYQFIIKAMREGDISFVAPFRYTSLLWALILGFMVFGEIPDAFMIAGAACIVLSGLYTLYREHKLGRKRKPATESTGPTMAPDGL